MQTDIKLREISSNLDSFLSLCGMAGREGDFERSKKEQLISSWILKKNNSRIRLNTKIGFRILKSQNH
mgnify:CR=1 FL=1